MARVPVTIVDRQFATLVTKMTPRYERSQMLRMVSSLFTALRGDTGGAVGPYPDLESPPRYKMYTCPIFNLTHLEMLCGATQFLCGLVVFLYMALMLPGFHDPVTGENKTVGRYFDVGDGQCDRLGKLLCYHPDMLVPVLRCVKELMNILSPWIEWRLTPLKYLQSSAEPLPSAAEPHSALWLSDWGGSEPHSRWRCVLTGARVAGTPTTRLTSAITSRPFSLTRPARQP